MNANKIMKTTNILRTIGLISALSLSSFALISCDSGSDNNNTNNGGNGDNNGGTGDNGGNGDNGGTGDTQKALSLKVDSTISWTEPGGNGDPAEDVTATIKTYDSDTQTGTVNVIAGGETFENVNFTYKFEGDTDSFVLEEFVLSETDAIARINKEFGDPNSEITKAKNKLNDPPTEDQLDDLYEAVDNEKGELGFTIDFTFDGGESDVFLVRNSELAVKRGEKDGEFIVRGPVIELNDAGTEVKLTSNNSEFRDIVVDVVITP